MGDDDSFSIEERCRRIDDHVGERIRQRRKGLEVSQEQLATMLGITFQQVQKYERGANRVSASRLWDIARALECEVADFFEGLDDAQGHGTLANGVSNLLTSAEKQALLAAFSAIRSSRKRKAMVALVVEIADQRVGP